MVKTPSVKRRSRKGKGLALFATTFAGLEGVLESELRSLGAIGVRKAVRGVAFEGDLGLVYRANLWLRTAHRVLVQIAEFDASDRQALYDGAKQIDWMEHMVPDQTLAVDAVSASSAMGHTKFISQVVKDGVVDHFRDKVSRRPSVDTKAPDLALNVRLANDRCTLSWDASGEKLHRRGYRPSFGGPAPLKENLAAGLLLLSGYDGTGPLVDPMCGSGTILVEAALIAKNIAPGLLGRRFNLCNHPTFDKNLWSDVQEDARSSAREVEGCPIGGSDISPDAVRAARTAVQGAGVDDIVKIRIGDLRDLPVHGAGRAICNPPYGERLGEMGRLGDLYQLLGDVLKNRCKGMSGHVLAGSKFLAGKIGLRTTRRDILWNGAIECRLLHYDLY